MAAAKMETSAERYRRIKAERAKNEELFDFESPSGMTWKLRRPDLGVFITSGIMPVDLAAKMAETMTDDTPEETFNKLDWKEKLKSLEFSAKVVRYCAVEPKIVASPSAPDEIGYDEVEMDDFNAIFTWAMPGGGQAESLDAFHSERERLPVVLPNVQGNGNSRKPKARAARR